jgi:hypothetical protein
VIALTEFDCNVSVEKPDIFIFLIAIFNVSFSVGHYG